MTDLFTTGDIIAIITVIIAVLGLGVGIGQWKKGLDTKLAIIGAKASAVTTMLHTLVRLLASGKIVDASQVGQLFTDYQAEISKFEKGVTNPITPDMARRRQELTEKLNSNQINLDQAKELKNILDQELAEARSSNDNLGAVIAIGLLIILVVAVVAALSGGQRQTSHRSS